MNLDEKDLSMLAVSVSVVDYWEMKEEIDRLSSTVGRLEKIVKTLVILYHEERVRDWELILKHMMQQKDRKDGKWKT